MMERSAKVTGGRKKGRLYAALKKLEKAGRTSSFARAAIIAAAGFFLGRAVIFGSYAPFGTAFCAAYSGEKGMLPAFLGAAAGAVSVAGRINPIKYLAAMLILFLVSEAMRKVKKLDTTGYAVTSLVFVLGLVGLIFLITGESDWLASMVFSAEVFLSAFACAMFRYVIRMGGRLRDRDESERYMICLFALAGIAMHAVPAITIGGLEFSPARIAGMFLVIKAAHEADIYGGVVTGLIMGLVSDLSGGEMPLYTAVYAVAGLAAGLFKKRMALARAGVFFAVSAAWLLLDGGTMAAGTVECAAACILYLLLAEKFALNIVKGEKDGRRRYDEQIKRHFYARISGLASAYDELSRSVMPKEEENRAGESFNPCIIAFRTACKKCEQCGSCWREHRQESKTALSRALPPALARGRALPEDFGAEFAARCVKIEAVCGEITGLIRQNREKKREEAIRSESRELLSKQYEQLSDMLDMSARDLNENLIFEKNTEQAVRSRLRELGIGCEALAYRDGGGGLRLEICGQGLGELCIDMEALRTELCSVTGVELLPPEQIYGSRIQCISFCEKKEYSCAVGAKAEKKEEEQISGDCGTYFTLRDGSTCVILCDGMGSGRRAHELAANTLKITESFLRAGIDPKNAADIVKSAIRIKSDEEEYSTIDIALINPSEGRLSCVKCGAAPTYVRRKDSNGNHIVIEISRNGADPGGYILETYGKEMFLKEGDMVIMMSDGADCGADKEKTIECIRAVRAEDPRELCEILIRLLKGPGSADDRTIIAIRYNKTAAKALN